MEDNEEKIAEMFRRVRKNLSEKTGKTEEEVATKINYMMKWMESTINSYMVAIHRERINFMKLYDNSPREVKESVADTLLQIELSVIMTHISEIIEVTKGIESTTAKDANRKTTDAYRILSEGCTSMKSYGG